MNHELPITELHATNIARRAAMNALKGNHGAPYQIDDLINEGLLAIYQGAGRYDPSKSSFSTFAYQKAYYRCLDVFRSGSWIKKKELSKIKNAQLRPCRIENSSQITATGIDLDIIQAHQPQHDQQRLTEEVEHIFSFCSQKTVTLLSLYYLEGLSMREIGLRMGVSESAISLEHSAILKHLKEVFHVTSVSVKSPKSLSMRDQLAMRYMEILIPNGASPVSAAIHARAFANAILDALHHPYEPNPISPEPKERAA